MSLYLKNRDRVGLETPGEVVSKVFCAADDRYDFGRFGNRIGVGWISGRQNRGGSLGFDVRKSIHGQLSRKRGLSGIHYFQIQHPRRGIAGRSDEERWKLL